MRLKIILGKTSETTMVVDAATGDPVEGAINILFHDSAVYGIYSVAISFDVLSVDLELAEAIPVARVLEVGLGAEIAS